MKRLLFYIRNYFRKTPKLWFTSDSHFGHRNILNYCKRPYKNLDDMREGLIRQWNLTVKPFDTVYHLGDFSFNKKWSAEIVPRLNGRKILITGNHDECFAHTGRSPSKIQKLRDKYFEHGWSEIHKQTTLQLNDGRFVYLNHFPESLNEDIRYPEHRPVFVGLPIIHGHLHGHYFKKGNCIDVGYDVKQRLISEDEIIEALEDSRDFIPARYPHKRGGEHENNSDY